MQWLLGQKFAVWRPGYYQERLCAADHVLVVAENTHIPSKYIFNLKQQIPTSIPQPPSHNPLCAAATLAHQAIQLKEHQHMCPVWLPHSWHYVHLYLYAYKFMCLNENTYNYPANMAKHCTYVYIHMSIRY